jgi:hypothetical protein
MGASERLDPTWFPKALFPAQGAITELSEAKYQFFHDLHNI